MMKFMKKFTVKPVSSKQSNISEKSENNRLIENATGLLDLILPDCIEEGKDYIYLGPERYARVYVVAVYPSDIYLTFFQTFFNIGQISMSVYIEPADTGDVIRKLSRMITDLRANIILEGNKPVDYQKLQQAEDFELLRASLQRGIEKILYVQIFFTIYADSLEKLKEKCIEFKKQM